MTHYDCSLSARQIWRCALPGVITDVIPCVVQATRDSALEVSFGMFSIHHFSDSQINFEHPLFFRVDSTRPRPPLPFNTLSDPVDSFMTYRPHTPQRPFALSPALPLLLHPLDLPTTSKLSG